MKHADFFGIYDDALSAEFCKSVIQKFEDDTRKEQGRLGGYDKNDGINTNIKDTTELVLDNSKIDWKPEFDVVIASLKENLAKYVEPFQKSLNVPIAPELFKVTRYDVGGKFTMHSDNIGGATEVTRIITAIWYLNDVEEGGETEYPWQDQMIKPQQGRLLLCPVGWPYIHQGLPPVSGPKYIIITQLHQQV